MPSLSNRLMKRLNALRLPLSSYRFCILPPSSSTRHPDRSETVITKYSLSERGAECGEIPRTTEVGDKRKADARMCQNIDATGTEEQASIRELKSQDDAAYNESRELAATVESKFEIVGVGNGSEGPAWPCERVLFCRMEIDASQGATPIEVVEFGRLNGGVDCDIEGTDTRQREGWWVLAVAQHRRRFRRGCQGNGEQTECNANRQSKPSHNDPPLNYEISAQTSRCDPDMRSMTELPSGKVFRSTLPEVRMNRFGRKMAALPSKRWINEPSA